MIGAKSVSADVPAGYTAQSQHEMGVTGTTMLDLAVLDVIRWEVRVYRLEFDPAYYLWLTEVEERFWTEHVQTRNPPPAEWDDRINPPTPLVVRPGTIDLGPEAAELLAKRKRIIAIRDEATRRFRTLPNRSWGCSARVRRASRAVHGEAHLRPGRGGQLRPQGQLAGPREPGRGVVTERSEPNGADKTIACFFLVLCVCVVSVAVALNLPRRDVVAPLDGRRRVTTERQKSIDLRMRTEFEAVPLRQMIRWEHG